MTALPADTRRIASIRAHAIRIPRDLVDSTGTAGSPARLTAPLPSARTSSAYRWAENYRTVYSTNIETVLIRVETDDGIVGWGESQAPVAPEVTATIVNSLLGPLAEGEDALAPEALRDRLYAAMRVRGHTGSFLVDAIAGIDIAIWDICGKAYGQPVYRLLGGPVRTSLPCYISGLAGGTLEEKMAYAREQVERGATAFKLFMHDSPRELLAELRSLRDEFGGGIELFVDVLWRLTPRSALALSRSLAELEVGWLEAPTMPEDVRGHRRLARAAAVPIALGESYRTRYELLPFLESGAVDVVQPDIGRTGITEARKIATLAETFHLPIAPHVSIGLGPQIAAVLHFGAACGNLRVVECNPKVYQVANQFLRQPMEFGAAVLPVPEGPGLGIELDEQALRPFLQLPHRGVSP